MASMFSIGIISQHVHWIWLHLLWEHICLSFQFLPCITHCKTDHKFFLFLYPCIFGNETWQLLPSRNGEFISPFFESGFRHMADVGQGALKNLIQAEPWWMPEQCGFPFWPFLGGWETRGPATFRDPKVSYSPSGMWIKPLTTNWS